MIEFLLSLQFLFGLLLGAFVGVGLGMRSSSARAFHDRARKEYDDLIAEYRRELAEWKAERLRE